MRLSRRSILQLLAAIGFLCGAGRAAAAVTLTTAPRDDQLFARDSTGTGEVLFAGSVSAAGHDTLRLSVLRDGIPWCEDRIGLPANGRDETPFHLSCRIRAELAEYTANLWLDDSLVTSRDSLVCGDVYLIEGQSNAQAADFQQLCTERGEFLRSFGSSTPSPGECAADTSWGVAQGHVTYSHACVGVWGLHMGLSLIEKYQVPIAILNGAVGATDIIQHLRNDAHPEDLGTIYGRLLFRAHKAGIARNVLAILWHQGEFDSDSRWIYYRQRFAALWNAWEEDYSPLRLVYVFQDRPNWTWCGGDYESKLREVQRTQPDYFPNIRLISTNGLRGHEYDGCHYTHDGYAHKGLIVAPLLGRDFYGETDTLHIDAPNVEHAWFTSGARNELRLRFTDDVRWPADTLGYSLRDYFFIEGLPGHVLSGRVDDDRRTVVLTLRGPELGSHVTYLPNCCYPNTYPYEGPWIRNPRGLGALSFDELPIEDPAAVEGDGRSRQGPFAGAAPNPFRGSTEIRFALDRPGRIRVEIYDVSGREVRLLAAPWLPPGEHVIGWDGKSASGIPVPGGTYLYKLVGSAEGSSGKLFLIR